MVNRPTTMNAGNQDHLLDTLVFRLAASAVLLIIASYAGVALLA